MKQYCPNCGAGTEYSLSAPKFCSSCGGGFGVAAIANSSRRLVPSRKRPTVILEDEEGEYSYDEDEPVHLKIPKKLDFTVEDIPTLQRISASELVGRPMEGGNFPRDNRVLSKEAKLQKVQEFRQKLQTTQRHDAQGNE